MINPTLASPRRRPLPSLRKTRTTKSLRKWETLKNDHFIHFCAQNDLKLVQEGLEASESSSPGLNNNQGADVNGSSLAHKPPGDTATVTIRREKEDSSSGLSRLSDEQVMAEMRKICNPSNPRERFKKSKEVGSGYETFLWQKKRLLFLKKYISSFTGRQGQCTQPLTKWPGSEWQ